MNQSSDSLEFSRLTATAASLGDAAPDRHRFGHQPVLLTGETEVLRTQNGRNCFLDSIRLLIKIATRLTIHIPQSSRLENEVRQVVESLSYRSRPEVQCSLERPKAAFDAILSVGTSGNRDSPWTVINSNGWTARVASTGRSLSSECAQPNPVGALGAACFGVGEVFKRLIKLKPERGRLHDGLSFSFHSYLPEDLPGPELPRELPLDLILVGMGAINNGTIRLLKALPMPGAKSNSRKTDGFNMDLLRRRFLHLIH